MNRQRLDEILQRIPLLRVLVVGDFFLDKYLDIDRALAEISLETNLEAHQVTGVRVSPGAAGTVVNNLVALGARVAALGVIGDTGEGYEFLRALDASSVDHSPILRRRDWLMPTYIKPMLHERDGRVRELERLDIKNRAPLSDDVIQELLARLDAAVAHADVVIISEYIPPSEGGIITDAVRARIVALAAANPAKFFIVDSRPATARYRHVIVKCNLREATHALGRAYDPHLAFGAIEALAREFERRTAARLFLTLGERGMLVCARQECTHVPTVVEPGAVDIVGAGDSALAGIACALGVGASNTEAALLGNLAAAVTVKKIGTTGTASPTEVAEKFQVWERMEREGAREGTGDIETLR
jgi:rfaE bifunctional protein kinase chain/domain